MTLIYLNLIPWILSVHSVPWAWVSQLNISLLKKILLSPDFALWETVANSFLASFPKPLVIYLLPQLSVCSPLFPFLTGKPTLLLIFLPVLLYIFLDFNFILKGENNHCTLLKLYTRNVYNNVITLSVLPSMLFWIDFKVVLSFLNLLEDWTVVPVEFSIKKS